MRWNETKLTLYEAVNGQPETIGKIMDRVERNYQLKLWAIKTVPLKETNNGYENNKRQVSSWNFNQVLTAVLIQL